MIRSLTILLKEVGVELLEILPKFQISLGLSGSESYFFMFRVQNSSRLSAVAGTLTTLAGYFSPKKHKISCLDRPTEFKVAVS